MKTAVVFFRSKCQNFDGEYYQKVVSIFIRGGIAVDEIAILSPSDDTAFIRRLEELKNAFDNLIIFDGERCEFNLKETLAEKMETTLSENENAKSFVTALSNGGNSFDKYSLLPVDGTLIPNARGVYQGFILDSNEFSLCVLPEKFNECKVMCEKNLLPYLKKKFHISEKRLTLKYFGNMEKCEQTLNNAKGQIDGIEYDIFYQYGDGTISVTFSDKIQDGDKNEFTRKVIAELKEDIYAEFETTLGERLFDVLKIKNLKLSIAESFTGGGVANAVVKNSGVSEFFTEGLVTYSNESKIDRLGVSEKAIKEHGAVSSVVAYQMAIGLLKKGNCDIAVATTGIAGPNSDGTDKPVGLAFIAVGMKDGVHTYRFHFDGTREEIMETAKNTALFLTIKKLKNM